MVMGTEVDEVDGCTHPQVEAWQPHQDSVLEALSEVWVSSVPCTVPILGEARIKKSIKPKKPTLNLNNAFQVDAKSLVTWCDHTNVQVVKPK